MVQSLLISSLLRAIPAARPRVSRKGFAYILKSNKEFQQKLALDIVKTVKAYDWHIDDIAVFDITVVCNVPRNKADTDNMLKLIMDTVTITKSIWKDDFQVKRCSLTVFDTPKPSILISINKYKNYDEFYTNLIT